MGLHIAKDLSLPVDAVGETFAFLARRGAGKTYSAMVLAEEMLEAGAQIVVFDPISKWWGLRLSADGKKKGYEIPVFGGPHADVNLYPTAGELVAEVLVKRGVSAILDLSGFRSDAEHRRFVVDFAQRFYRLKQAQSPPTPVHLFFEEAEEFLPQDQMHDQAVMVGAVKKLIKLGRNYGIGCTLVSQRSADLNKKGLSQVGTLVALQTTSPHDKKAIREWTHGAGENADPVEELPRLEVGEAFVWSPSLGISRRLRFRKKKTFDTSSTPKLGKQKGKIEPPRLKASDLSHLTEAMAAVDQEKKDGDPALLRKRIRELEQKLAAAPTKPTVERVEVEVPVLGPDDRKRIDRIAKVLETATGELQRAKDSMAELSAKLPGAAPPPRPAPSKPVPTVLARRAARPAAAPSADSALTKPEQRVLDALSWMATIGVDAPEVTAVAFLAGYTVGTGTFNNIRGKLRAQGLVEYVGGGCMKLTPAGAAAAAPEEAPLTVDALHAAVMARLPGPLQRVLRPLLEAYPDGLSNEDLAAASGYTVGTGTFNNQKGRLRSLGLVDYPSPGHVIARDILFPAGA